LFLIVFQNSGIFHAVETGTFYNNTKYLNCTLIVMDQNFKLFKVSSKPVFLPKKEGIGVFLNLKIRLRPLSPAGQRRFTLYNH